jgi:hypothetical protein
MAQKDAVRQLARDNDAGKPRFAKAYGFALVTGAFFLISWAGQFVAQIFVEQNEAEQHGQVSSGCSSSRSSSHRPSRTGSRSSVKPLAVVFRGDA